jgi:hypothetical protein
MASSDFSYFSQLIKDLIFNSFFFGGHFKMQNSENSFIGIYPIDVNFNQFIDSNRVQIFNQQVFYLNL